jgi:7-cyano-7-deazaguanine synthase
VGVLLSGGLDSSILVWKLLDEGRSVQPIYVASGLIWQRAEMAAVEAMLRASASPRLAALVKLELPLADVYGEHWSVTGRNVPGAETDDAAVYLPGRNPLLIVKARLWCQLHGLPQLALGCLRSNPFADATDAFFDRFATLMDEATSGQVELVRPLAKLDKGDVMRLARGYPLERTFSCLAPRGLVHCGRCNKCAERASAFAEAGIIDPTQYAEPPVLAAARP